MFVCLLAYKVSSNACTLIHHREAFEDYLSLDGHIDIVIPRGGRELQQFVNNSTKIPVLGDAEALCHVYVHKDANVAMAANIIADSKCRHVSSSSFDMHVSLSLHDLISLPTLSAGMYPPHLTCILLLI
jgi:gamma-glutamyl phosphate reductase